MTATLPSESRSSTRRAFLAGALGGIGAWAASAIGRASPALATDGQAILQGVDNSGSVSTLVRSNAATAAFQGLADSTTGTTYGLRGRNSALLGAGVYGVASNTGGSSVGVLGTSATELGAGVHGDGGSSGAPGVKGTSVSNVGVFGVSDAVWGIRGASSSTSHAGIIGYTLGNSTGVLGQSSQGNLVSSPAKTGVYGFADQDTVSVGVRGESPAGFGVYGKTATGFAGYFNGKAFFSQFEEIAVMSTPTAPGGGRARVFVRSSGGRLQLCVRFPTGTVKVIAAE
jgi:hypothetical protein